MTTLAAGDDVNIVRSFPGNKGPGWKQTIDVAGAVGPRHVVSFDVAGFVVHDKNDGKQRQRLTSREFWQRVEPAGKVVPRNDANDARMLYDPLSERWFACAAGTSEPDCFLAVSASSDPTGTWRGAKLPLPRIDPYMRIGTDKNGVYVCSSNGNHDMAKGTFCYVLPKADALAKDGPVLTHGQSFDHLQFSTMPAIDNDPNKPVDAPAVFLANEFAEGTCGHLYLYKLTWSGTKARLSAAITVPLSRAYPTPNNTTPLMQATQPKPGPKLQAGGGGRRINSAFVHKGSVYGCNGAVRDTTRSRPGVLWYEIKIDDGKLVQEGLVDSPDRDLIFPTVAVDGDGNIGIGCTGSSATEFPSIYAMMHKSTDPAGTMRKPFVAVPGTTSYHYEGIKVVNLSHYSVTCIDPSNPELFWTCQAYANSKVDREWCTAWAAFRFSKGEQREKTDRKITANIATFREPHQQEYKVYNHVIPATPPAKGDHSFRLVLPEGLDAVRGILVVGPYSGGDSRDYHRQVWYREFMNFHGFAFLGATNFYLHDYSIMQAALKHFAEETKHPELVNAPYAATGFSAGGGYTRLLMKADPGKVIAGVVVGSTMKLRGELTDDHRGVPMCIINGDLEHVPGEGGGLANALEPVLAEQRPKGALWSWMAVQGVGHEFAGQEVLSMPILDAAVRLRYPADGDTRKGPVKLKKVDSASGWIADNRTWMSGMTSLAPARDFKGDVAKSSWLLNEDIAFIYRAYSSCDWKLTITSPARESARDKVHEAGSAVKIVVDDSRFRGWKKLELYEGAKKVAGLESSQPAAFTVKDLKPGYHAFSVLGTDGKGNLRPSNPVLVVVKE